MDEEGFTIKIYYNDSKNIKKIDQECFLHNKFIAKHPSAI